MIWHTVFMETKDARSLAPIAQQELRQRAVKAVIEGKKQVEVAQMFGVTRQALGRWVKAYREGGLRALNQKKQGRPSGGSLNPKQERRMAKIVIDKRPNQLKLPFYLWTREAVVHLIKEKLGIELSIWTAGRYLKRWGSPLKNRFAAPMNEVSLGFNAGSTKNIQSSKNRQPLKKLRYFGLMRWGFAQIIPAGQLTEEKARRRWFPSLETGSAAI